MLESYSINSYYKCLSDISYEGINEAKVVVELAADTKVVVFAAGIIPFDTEVVVTGYVYNFLDKFFLHFLI